jgi:hypothetical protein
MTCGEMKGPGMKEVLEYWHEYLRKGIGLYRSGRIAYVQIES